MCASVCAGVVQVCVHMYWCMILLRCVLHAVEASAE